YSRLSLSYLFCIISPPPPPSPLFPYTTLFRSRLIPIPIITSYVLYSLILSILQAIFHEHLQFTFYLYTKKESTIHPCLKLVHIITKLQSTCFFTVKNNEHQHLYSPFSTMMIKNQS